MKILFLNYEYPPLGGGAAQATEALLRVWATASGHEVHLVTSAVGNVREDIRLGGKVYIHRLPIGKNPAKLHSQSIRDILVYTWRAWFFLSRFIPEENKKKPFDISLAFFTVPCGFLAYLLQLFYRIPYVISLRGADVPGFSEKYDTLYFFLSPLIKHIWRQAKSVIANSPGLKDLARRTDKKVAIEIIENGVDTELFRPATKKTEGKTIFLTVARLTRRKSINCLIAAFAEMAARAPGGELWIAGIGEEQERLKAQTHDLGLESQVKFLGRLDHENLPGIYQAAGVFVLPSKNEGMSNAALEALASGLPLVVSETGGMQELVTENENGFFVDPEDAKEFATTMMKFVENPSLIEKMGAVARTKAVTRSWEKVSARYTGILTK